MSVPTRLKRPLVLVAVAAEVFLPSWAAAATADVIVKVGGIAASTGEIGCALFPAGPAFPMDNSTARQVWLPADAAGVTFMGGSGPCPGASM